MPQPDRDPGVLAKGQGHGYNRAGRTCFGAGVIGVKWGGGGEEEAWMRIPTSSLKRMV